MCRPHDLKQTSWQRGPFRLWPRGLMFGQTYEDHRIELESFPPRSRVFCIAGAGYTARALAAAGHQVTAVDINPAQLEYAKSRVTGSPPHAGMAESLLWFGRRLVSLAGWTRARLEVFLSLSDCSEQAEFWDRELDTARWRSTFDLLLAPRLLSLFYRNPFVDSLPRDFGPRLRQRLRRGWANHSNRHNPFAAALLVGRPLPEPDAPGTPVRFICADAAHFLSSCPPRSFEAISLSNIGDGASPDYLRHLQSAVAHAAVPGATIVSRSFLEPGFDSESNQAALDRSLLWAAVLVKQVGAVVKGGVSCCTS